MKTSYLPALAAFVLWGAAVAWDKTSTVHNLANGCVELNPDRATFAHEAEIGVALAVLTPRRWKGPAVTVWFGTNALAHANAAAHNQTLFKGCR